MTIAHCPKCHEQVLVPGGTSRQAQVRCPLCSEVYLLGDALSSLPPPLVVLHDPEPPTQEPETRLAPAVSPFPQSRPGDSESIYLEEPPEVGNIELAPASSAPAIQFEGRVPSPARSHSASRSRPRRKQGSPLRLIVQTIGGGMMGLVIAQLILWWMPGNWHANNRDPFGLAAKVATYAPFIVPAALRGNAPTARATSMESSAGSTSSVVDTATAPGEPDNSIAETGVEPESSIPDFNFKAGANTTKKKSPRPGNSETAKSKKVPQSEPLPAAEEFPLAGLGEDKPPPTSVETSAPDSIAIPDLSLDAAPPPLKGDDKLNKKGSPPEPKVTAAAKVAASPAERMSEPYGLREPPEIDAEQLAARIEGVAFADRAWTTAQDPSREEMRNLITDLHDKLAQLGDAAAILSSTQPNAGGPLLPVKEQLQSLAQNQQTVTYVGQLSGLRIEDIQDAGAVVVGVVESHAARGKLHETKIQCKSKSGIALEMISTMDLAEELPAGTNVLILGRIVADPGKNLIGYEGDTRKVLLHGAHVVIAEP